jgi:flavin-dependent dehydrogenase
VGVRLGAGVDVWGGDECLYSNSNQIWLARPEGDDASDGIVGGHPNGHAISRDNFDAEAAHTAAELGQHFVAGITLHAVQPATVNGHDGALHVNQIILAQLLAVLSIKQTLCHS